MATTQLNQTIEKALQDLLSERARLDAAIRELQGLLGGKQVTAKRGPGRPPGSKNAVKKATATSKRGRGWSPAARKAAAERMKKYWADRRKG